MSQLILRQGCLFSLYTVILSSLLSQLLVLSSFLRVVQFALWRFEASKVGSNLEPTCSPHRLCKGKKKSNSHPQLHHHAMTASRCIYAIDPLRASGRKSESGSLYCRHRIVRKASFLTLTMHQQSALQAASATVALPVTIHGICARREAEIMRGSTETMQCTIIGYHYDDVHPHPHF